MIHIMEKISKPKDHQSQLRKKHKEYTRDLIIEGLIRAMINDPVTWSVPDVASEAGVSIATVYRYFRTKEKLIQGLGAYVGRKLGVFDLQPPHTIQEYISTTRSFYRGSGDHIDALRMFIASELHTEERGRFISTRLQLIRDMFSSVLPTFQEQEREYLVRIILLLSSSVMVLAFKDYLDLSGEEAAETVTWAILKLANAGGSAGEDDTPASGCETQL